MPQHADKSQSDARQSSKAVARKGNESSEHQTYLEDERVEATTQRKLKQLANDAVSEQQVSQLQALHDHAEEQSHDALHMLQPVQRHPQNHTIQLEDDDDDTVPLLSGEARSDEQDEAIKQFGLSLVGAYRVLGEASEHLSKGKNREAIKAAVLSLGNTAILVGTALIGVPGVVSVGAEGLAVSATAESAGVTGGSAAAGSAMGAAETEAPTAHDEATAAAESAGLAMKAIIKKKAGTLKDAGKTLISFVPGSAILKNAAKSAKLAMMSQDEWNAARAELITVVEGVMTEMDSVVAGLDLDKYGDTVIKAKGSKLLFTDKTKTLEDISKKYKARAKELKETIAAWDKKHGESRPLLSGASSSDEA